MKQRIFWLFTAVVGLVLVYAWWGSYGFSPGDRIVLRQLNRLFAVLGFYFFLLQFFLSSRVRLLERGYGQNIMILHHRLVGRIALGFLLLHPVFYFVYQGEVIIHNVFRVIGVVVLLGLFVTAAVAVLHKRLKLAYELWLHIHKVNYVLFPLVFVHVFYNAIPGTLLYTFWLAFAVLFAGLLIHKVAKEISMRKHAYEVVDIRQEAKDIWSLFFRGRPLDYQPGQFMYLRLVRDGKVSSSHPFTISSSPTWGQLSVTPKNLGDFTATIPKTKVGDKAFIDAPYGVFSFKNFQCEQIMLLAGGIGVTPFMSMLRYIYDQKIEIPVTLLWGNKSEEELCFRDELKEIADEMNNVKIVYVMSRQDDWTGEKGRIDRKLIEKYLTGEGTYDFFVCGPPPMSKAALAALREIGVNNDKIHHELFEF